VAVAISSALYDCYTVSNMYICIYTLQSQESSCEETTKLVKLQNLMKTFAFTFSFDYYTSPQSYLKKTLHQLIYLLWSKIQCTIYCYITHVFALNNYKERAKFFLGKIVFSYDSISITNLYEGKSVSSYFYCIIQLLIIPYKKTNSGQWVFLVF